MDCRPDMNHIPLNSLPTIITGPGVYVTRGGRKVTIRSVSPPTGRRVTEFRAKGSIWCHAAKMGINPEYDAWHVSGRLYALGESALDIVGKA